MRAILILLLAATFATAGTPDRSDWKKAWTRARRADAYQYPTNGLVSYWSMDSVVSNTVYDTFGSNNGTAVGSPLFDSAYGKYLDGVNFATALSQRIDVGTSGYGTATTNSFSMWVKASHAATFRILFACGDTSGTENRAGVLFTNGNKIRWFTVLPSSTFAEWDTTASFPDNEWFYLVVAVSSGSVAVYINGQSAAGAITAGNIANVRAWGGLSGAKLTAIGSRIINGSYGLYMNGSMDEIAIFNRALSSNEVSEIYNNGAGRFYTP